MKDVFTTKVSTKGGEDGGVSQDVEMVSKSIEINYKPQDNKGKLGGEIFNEAGLEAAKLCAINVLAQAKAALGGDLGRIKRCVRLGGFINATPHFAALPAIMNGASDFMVEVLGDAGRHARSTVGVANLPADAAVEVEAMFEIA